MAQEDSFLFNNSPPPQPNFVQLSLPPAIAAIATLRILDLGTETGGQVGFSWLASWLAQERPDLHIFEDFYYH